jgi:hypothetical protein
MRIFSISLIALLLTQASVSYAYKTHPNRELLNGKRQTKRAEVLSFKRKETDEDNDQEYSKSTFIEGLYRFVPGIENLESAL